ncbi:O-acetyl-ADP-ribose deacetylase (regulator of RNase III), contains Macro domain [Actinokineospora alba]|uniref:O-acetyl-ADP-ribose deacetylase (Regulator of RNase III), contains Macro domain n=1 Tax=Actinokineospora alba TaxID=504798 RepID=A0A1H0UIH9_9PSEU|nr:macro domain-containing protein [Actinokineospora alba]TDP65071.1 O-acetyl-ADP-ribose deacetylase (regulator of RNase III) [Actinokineospora alba]SDH53403.1 O-acetyl-ADP-ribose deacetylase (regulator of RNase III), contains Macro domain [Actinokineospora alba]SDP65778.1 O-acetyl-ADP-ribose deacetylase (regulator of RNase III), contains Macro domain [Actinokineospora alba]
MGSLKTVPGDATAPEGSGPRVIAHICNDTGGWGKGFVLALSARWPEPEREYRRWYRERAGNDFALGATQFVEVEPGLRVANMVAQHGLRPTKAGPPIRYDALERCLNEVAAKAADLGASVHLPRIGAGLAGGDWDRIEAMIRDALAEHGVHGTVYLRE